MRPGLEEGIPLNSNKDQSEDILILQQILNLDNDSFKRPAPESLKEDVKNYLTVVFGKLTSSELCSP